MIAPIKGPSTRKDLRRPSAGLVRAHRWISKTLLIDSASSRVRRPADLRTWLAVIWIAVVAAFYFARLIGEWIEAR